MNRKAYPAAIASLLVVLLLPLLHIGSFYVTFLFLIFMYSTVANGWNILTGYTGYFSFGHVAFFGIGAYTAALVTLGFGISPLFTCIIGGGVACLFAFLVGFPTLRLKGAYFAIVTMGLAFALQVAVSNLGFTGGTIGLSLPLPPWDSTTTAEVFYYAMLLVLLGSILTTYYLDRSKFGLAFRSIRDDETAAESSGIPTSRFKMMAFLFSSFFPGVAGGLYSYYATYIDPITVFGILISIFAIVFTIFGGSGTVLGPTIGTVILFSLYEEMSYTFTSSGADLIIFAVIAMAAIMLMPQGVLGVLRERLHVKFQ